MIDDCTLSHHKLKNDLTMNDTKKGYLPKMISKKELAAYCGYETTKALYTSVLTQELVKEAGYTLEEIRSRSCKRLPLDLTRLIYQKYKIESLY